MPTITLQVGQCGNQLGDTLWSLLLQNAKQQPSGAREFFFSSSSSSCCTRDGNRSPVPRVIRVDSEAKVVRQWSSQAGAGSAADHRLHVLGHGGCGNNWACGYSFGVSSSQDPARSAWSSSDAAASRVDQVLEGVRRECELDAGVPDFLLLASLAGGTGSGTGSALLEVLADEYPASTIAAVAVAPGRSGDSTVQSINTCLALQHLQTHANAVVLIDNQAILHQLDNESFCSSSSRQICLQDVNKVAAEALMGLLWPIREEDHLAGRSNLRQLTSTICCDPLAKFVEVCSLSQADSAWTSGSSSFISTRGAGSNPWSARTKLLSSRLPKYDLSSLGSTPVVTSAAFVITRGMPGTAVAGCATRPPSLTAAAITAQKLAAARVGAISAAAAATWSAAAPHSKGGVAASGWQSFGCFAVPDNMPGAAASMPQTSWQQQLASTVCCSWPFFVGSEEDVHLGSSPVALWSAAAAAGTAGRTGASSITQQPSMTAAVRRSSIGTLMQAAADRSLQLCAAGAYMHWYERYGCRKADIQDAAFAVADAGAVYLDARK